MLYDIHIIVLQINPTIIHLCFSIIMSCCFTTISLFNIQLWLLFSIIYIDVFGDFSNAYVPSYHMLFYNCLYTKSFPDDFFSTIKFPFFKYLGNSLWVLLVKYKKKHTHSVAVKYFHEHCHHFASVVNKCYTFSYTHNIPSWKCLLQWKTMYSTAFFMLLKCTAWIISTCNFLMDS